MVKLNLNLSLEDGMRRYACIGLRYKGSCSSLFVAAVSVLEASAVGEDGRRIEAMAVAMTVGLVFSVAYCLPVVA